MILLANGSLAACGSNQFGQLGMGDAFLPSMVTTPMVVVIMEPKDPRYNHAKVSRGWGDDGAKASGDRMGDRTSGGGGATGGGGVTGGGVRVSHVACGGAHTVVTDADGRVFSAGSNSCGQLGRAGQSIT